MEEVLNDQLNSVQTGSTTITTTTNNQPSTSSTTVKLNLQKRKNSKKVVFTDDTIDNENLNRKKSKCCCIYEKPKITFDQSDSEPEDECNNCYGHKKDDVDKRSDNNETT